MEFIEMSGKTLLGLQGIDALQPDELRRLGVDDASIVRINRQGDVELRRTDRWDVIGGLLGDYDHKLRAATGLEWA